MDDLYRDEILEHYREPHNFGTLDAPDASYEGHNPLCGDQLVIYLKMGEDGKIADVSFVGKGCAISMASASMMTDLLKGRTAEDEIEAAKLTHGFDVESFPSLIDSDSVILRLRNLHRRP